ncbi:MAG: calcium-binding protein, partial [Merismopedia sp. SIO2A8]|nr:calcium-binding protein [Merismopedia sp. SIO2A8]
FFIKEKDGNDTIEGGGGNDTINGGTGADSMIGGAGNDVFTIDDLMDTVTELADGGIEDEIISTITIDTLSANVEKLTLDGGANINGTGNEEDNTIVGNTGNNILKGEGGTDTIEGGAGNDSLEGGASNDSLEGGIGDDTLNGGTGNDILTGGNGNDTYVVDSDEDIVTEEGTGEADIVQSFITFTLDADGRRTIENLTLLPFSGEIDGTGNALNNEITGNESKNNLVGNDGDDTLTGGGGDDTLNGGGGADEMDGGTGDDTYFINVIADPNDPESRGDTIINENADINVGGRDTVNTSVSLDLTTFDPTGALEIFELDGTGDLTLTGNAANNTFTGNSGNNELLGNGGNDTITGGAGNDTINGGTGIDTMSGGIGNDFYVVDDRDDSVTEARGEGIDTVQSSVTRTLSENVENLILTGIDNLDGTGNALNNRITGNAGNNTLDGNEGNDVLIGGQGDDTYIVDSNNDIVSEAELDENNAIVEGGDAGGGNDTVRASVDYILADDLEVLILEGSAISGTGNRGTNTIAGNNESNMLDGGDGQDTMIGGQGDDTYYVRQASDKVFESFDEDGISITGGGDADTVISFVNYDLTEVDGIENLTLSDADSLIDKNFNATGTTGKNVIKGNSGNNIITGNGGEDTLEGGDGNDTYVF